MVTTNPSQPYVPLNMEYQVEAEDTLLDDVLGAKKKAISRKRELLEEQLEVRKQNLEDNLKQIDIDLCRVGTIFLQLPYHDIEGRNRVVLNHKMPLYRERRQRMTEYLRDTATLKREQLDNELQHHSQTEREKLWK